MQGRLHIDPRISGIIHLVSEGDLARRLKALMTRHGLSAPRLAQQGGIPSASTITKILRGSTKDPDPGTLERIAKGFGMSYDDLVAELYPERVALLPSSKKSVTAVSTEVMAADLQLGQIGRYWHSLSAEDRDKLYRHFLELAEKYGSQQAKQPPIFPSSSLPEASNG